MKTPTLVRIGSLLVLACLLMPAGNAASAGVEKLPFGKTDGKDVDLYILTNANGMVAKITTYGARLTELDVPDRNGKMDDVVLGFDTLAGYLGKEPYFGAIVGRVGNRIANGRFSLNGKDYQLATNDGKNHLHGGKKGFDRVVWNAKISSDDSGPAVELSYLSPDGEEGYPGNCTVTVTYGLSKANELWIYYQVKTDADTPVNVTNHSYFNLGGAENGGILDDEVTLNADRYTPVDTTLIPTGELAPVAGTLFDLRHATRVGDHVREIHVGSFPAGFDHNFVLNNAAGGMIHPVATVYDPKSGRVMEVTSTEPGVQFYTGNFLDGTITGKKGVAYNQYWGIALETQHFPDSVNQPNFPSYVLKAGQTYTSTTVYKFSAR